MEKHHQMGEIRREGGERGREREREIKPANFSAEPAVHCVQPAADADDFLLELWLVILPPAAMRR